MSAPKHLTTELRAQLHRCADLLMDVIEATVDAPASRRRIAPGATHVDDVARQYAKNALARLGWPESKAPSR